MKILAVPDKIYNEMVERAKKAPARIKAIKAEMKRNAHIMKSFRSAMIKADHSWLDPKFVDGLLK